MHLKNKKAFVRHGIQVTIQAVDNYNASLFSLDGSAHNVSELSG